jgi:hypothetical protein
VIRRCACCLCLLDPETEGAGPICLSCVSLPDDDGLYGPALQYEVTEPRPLPGIPCCPDPVEEAGHA